MAGDEARWTAVAVLSDFGSDRRLVRTIADREVLLVRLGNDVVAVLNRCTHLGHALERGRVMAGQITCPLHGACFDLRTGAALSGPAVAPLQRFEARIADDRVEVRLP
ncbi:MAG TPA: Rieske (2Fe-2S) protein [Nevskiaceae bacterium]|nr:Rieske (2Fe-2S) protein [Nevskiaceae bacterium]